MPSILRLACDGAQSQSHSDDEEESSNYMGYVLALNGHKKYFCLFRPVFTGDDGSDSSSDTSFSSDSRRKSRSKSRSSSHSRSRSRSREDGSGSRRGSSRATSIEVHHKLDRLGLWMERLMEGTLPRIRVPAWPTLVDDTAEGWSWIKKISFQVCLLLFFFKALFCRCSLPLNCWNPVFYNSKMHILNCFVNVSTSTQCIMAQTLALASCVCKNVSLHSWG